MLEKFLTNSDGLNEKRKREICLALSQIREKMLLSLEKSPYRQQTRLLLATKTRSAEEINFAISQGIDLIGENRVQELCDKYDSINKEGVEIHFIGALQRNKVKYIIDKVDMIHSVDRLSLAEEIDRQAKKIGKVMNILCEINIGKEESKSGLDLEDAESFIREIAKFENIKVCGLMAIPPVLSDISTQKHYFQKIMDFYIDISAKKIDNVNMSVLSIGMSSDYDLAIEHGSTLVRIGTAAFGARI